MTESSKEGVFYLTEPKASYGFNDRGLFVTIFNDRDEVLIHVDETITQINTELTESQSILMDEYLDRSELFNEKGINPHPLLPDDITEILCTFGMSLDNPDLETVTITG